MAYAYFVGVGCAADERTQGSSDSDESADGEAPLPREPDCEKQIKVKFEDQKGLVRPGLRVADLLAPISTPVPIRLEADSKNQFVITPTLHGLQGNIHIEYDGGPVFYEYWKQPSQVGPTEARAQRCQDVVSTSAHLVLKTEGGELDESISGDIEFRFDAGRPVDLSGLVADFLPVPGELSSLKAKFEMGEAELAPGDELGDRSFELFSAFIGSIPEGRLVAMQEVIVQGSDAVGPRRPEVSARFYFRLAD